MSFQISGQPNWIDQVRDRLLESAEVQRHTSETCAESILEAAEAVAESLRLGGKLMLCGNGGSAADCQHIAAELVGRTQPGTERGALAALALTTDTSNLTALANDYGFQQIFERQVEALGCPGDVLVAVSTSGNSDNIIRAVKRAKTMGISCLGLLGGKGGSLARLVEVAITVPSDVTPRIQEAHIAIGHILCELVEQRLFPATLSRGIATDGLHKSTPALVQE